MSHALRTAQIVELSHQGRLPTLAHLAVSFAVVLTKWDTRIHSRRSLNRLDPHELTDIGLSQSQANAEATKPFWKA